MDKPRKIKKFGKLPINSRITIDYSGKKPKITFGYIAKKEQQSLTYANPVAMLLMMATIIILFSVIIYWPRTPYQPDIGTCGIYEEHLFNSTKVSAYNITCKNYSYRLEYQKGVGFYPFGQPNGFVMDTSTQPGISWMFHWTDFINKQPSYLRTILNLLLVIGMLVFCVGILVAILGMSYFYGWVLSKIPYLNKVVNKWTPEINARLSGAKYRATFRECPPDKVIEIPLFHNVLLDYDTGNPKTEFSRYLQRVEIREHPFDRLVKIGRLKNKKLKKYKKKHNISLWKARFIFKEVPKTGKLEVRWA